MVQKNRVPFILFLFLCTGCSGKMAGEITATPNFVTATLPSTSIPQTAEAVQSSTLPAPAPSAVEELIISPVDGTTTTQVNVRTGPSTASESLGMIGPFVKIQVIGKDASGSWFQVIYAESETGKGWVRAEYAQVNAPDEIPLVETTAASGTAVSGLVIQKINVRNGPGTEYELLGVLNSNDVVFITGKDPGGTWMQIEFASAPDGKGWVTAEFLQVGNLDSVPLIGAAVVEATSMAVTPTPGALVTSAMQDGDSMQAPLALVVFSPSSSRALQMIGDVSAPEGDVEDWIQFSNESGVVSIRLNCSGDTLRAELWNDKKPVDGFSLLCGDESFVTVTPNSSYFLRLSESDMNGHGYTKYILNLEGIR